MLGMNGQYPEYTLLPQNSREDKRMHVDENDVAMWKSS